jgi:hypothetical protein
MRTTMLATMLAMVAVAQGLSSAAKPMVRSELGSAEQAASSTFLCPCDPTKKQQEWNISTISGAAFVSSPSAESEGLASFLAEFDDHDPRHAVEGSATILYYFNQSGIRVTEMQWVVKSDTSQLMWASPETGGAKKGGTLCLTAFPAFEKADADPAPSPSPSPLGVWPCSERNSTKYPNWQTFVPVAKSVPIYSLTSPGGLCVSWAKEENSIC